MKLSDKLVPREQKTAQELYEDTELIDAKALLVVIAFLVLVMIAATISHNNTQRQAEPITTTVEDYR